MKHIVGGGRLQEIRSPLLEPSVRLNSWDCILIAPGQFTCELYCDHSRYALKLNLFLPRLVQQLETAKVGEEPSDQDLVDHLRH